MRLFCISISFLLGLKAVSQDLVPYRKNNLWGYADRNRNIVIQPQFEDASFFKNGLAQVKKDGKTWIIDTKGELKTKNGYETIFDFHNGLAAACRGGEFNYIQGEIVGGKWGYINENFEEVIPFIYARAEDFNGDYAIVQEKDNWGSWGVIDKVGRVVLPFKYPSYSFDMRPFPGIQWHHVKGQLQVDVSHSGEKWKIIDLKGKQIAPPKEGMHGLYQESEDIEYKTRMKMADAKTAELKKNNGMLNTPAGIFKTNGSVWCVGSGLYTVTVIDSDGSKKNGVYNDKNEIVVPFEYEQIASSMHDDMISVRKGGKWGFYDITGKQAVDCKYDFVSQYKNGLVYVSYNYSGKNRDNNSGYIDKNGTEFFESDSRLLIKRVNNKTNICDEYEKPIELEGSPLIKDATFIDSQHIIADLGQSMAVYNREGKKLVEAPIIIKLKKNRVLATTGNISQVIDANTGTVLIDSLVAETKFTHLTDHHFYIFARHPNKTTGVISPSGEVVLPFVYKNIKANGPYFIVTNEKDQQAITDTLNNLVKPFSIDGISGLSPQLFSIYLPAKKYYEIFDARTKTMTSYRLQNINEQNQTWVLNTIDKKHGLILKPTEEIIAPQYTGYTTSIFPNKTGNERFVVMTKNDKTLDLYNAQTGRLVITGAEETGPYNLPLFAVKSKGNFMFYNTDGQLISDKSYEAVGSLHSPLYLAVKSNGKWGVIDLSFQTVLDFLYTSVSGYSDGFFIAATNYKYGLVSLESKKNTIPFQYNYITHIGQYNDTTTSETPVQVYLVDRDEKSALFTSNHQQLTPFEFDDIIETLSNGFIVNKNGKPCFYAYNGKCLMEPGFDAIDIFDFSDPKGNDLLRVRKGKKYGLYNDRGEMLLACEYNKINNDEEYYYRGIMYTIIEKDGKKGMMGNDGKISIPVMYSDIQVEMMDGDAFIKVRSNGKAGLYKNFTRRLTLPEYEDITLYEDNLYLYYIPVQQKGLWGILDTSGKMLSQPLYTKLTLEETDEGYVLITRYGKRRGMLSLTGEVLLRPQFNSIDPVYDFNKSTYLVTMDKNYGLFDAKGKMIVPCNAYKIENHDEYPMVFYMQNGKRLGVSSDLEVIELSGK